LPNAEFPVSPFDGNVELVLPRVFSIDERTAANNLVQRLVSGPAQRRGRITTFTRGNLRGFLFDPADESARILIIPPNTRQLPDVDLHPYVLGATLDTARPVVDVSMGKWLRHPLFSTPAATAANETIEQVLASWDGAFSYVEEDIERGIAALRRPQLGALHGIHKHWTVSESTATIVMPTGTGKTDTMLAILVTAKCRRLLVIVPTDALRTQIASKFVTLGVLKAENSRNLASGALHPIVCMLEHIPVGVDEIDDIMRRAQVVVSTSSIAGQCSEQVQQRLAHHCPYLFIDEAHHTEAPTWKAFKEHFRERRIVQFTATPFREDGKPLDGVIAFEYPLRKAQAEGYFKPIRFEPVVEFDPKRSDDVIAKKAIDRLREDFDKGHIVMARVDGIARAKEVFAIYGQFPEFNPVELHTGIKSLKKREEAKRMLLSGESRIVVCIDMLGEGFDLPELKIAAFHDIRKSVAVTLQLAGRFTRERADLGNATFIANVADVDVQDELRKLYTRDPDWNALLPELSDKMIGEQSSLQEFMRGFADLPSDIPLNAARPATSAVVYRTTCTEWTPENFRDGIPSVDSCEYVKHSLNAQEHTLVIVTARHAPLPWLDAENLINLQWELYVLVWRPEQNLLFVNGSTNASDFRALAQAVTGDRAAIIQGQEVFRSFGGVHRLRLQNVGLTEHIGRNVRYTGRMGSDVESRLTLIQRGNAQKSVLQGTGYENGELVTVGASRKGRIWSHQRDRLDQFKKWCIGIGAKLQDSDIDPEQVLQGTLVPVRVTHLPEKRAIAIDWPEPVYTEREGRWYLTFEGTQYSLAELSIELVEPSTEGPLRFAIISASEETAFELGFFGEGESADYRFVPLGGKAVKINHGTSTQPRSIEEFFQEHPPVVWFADGSSLEGNQYIELRAIHPPFDRTRITVWDWSGIDIRKESQGEERRADTVQAKTIRELLRGDYEVIFDDDAPGEAADVVCIRLVGGFAKPQRLEVEFYHCKYSGDSAPGGRIGDLYEVCGQAQKSIWWASSPSKRSDLFTHLLRRESERLAKGRPTRLERGTEEMLLTIREISRVHPVSLSICVVQPGLSQAGVSDDQLQLLGVTQNHLMETYQLSFNVVASA
jgi:superfamily II DNA or RNA helicase